MTRETKRTIRIISAVIAGLIVLIKAPIWVTAPLAWLAIDYVLDNID